MFPFSSLIRMVLSRAVTIFYNSLFGISIILNILMFWTIISPVQKGVIPPYIDNVGRLVQQIFDSSHR